jgi:hypothetical protein
MFRLGGDSAFGRGDIVQCYTVIITPQVGIEGLEVGVVYVRPNGSISRGRGADGGAERDGGV